MKSRVIITALVVVAIGVLVAWIARNTYWDEVSIPTPLRGEAVKNPFYAAEKFVAALGATPERRQTLGTLGDEVDVLFLTNWHWDLIDERRNHIQAWVENGGRLIVDRTLIGGDAFSDWSGIGWEYPSSEENESDEDAAGEQAPSDETDDFLTEDASELCGELREVDDRGTVRDDGRKLSVCTLDVFSYLGTDRTIAWGYAHDEDLQALRTRVGSGTVTVLNLTPFGNRDLTDIDHGKMLVSATDLRIGDRIVFLSEHEHMSLLGLIWLHGAPVVMLSMAFLAAMLWRGGVRFGPLAATTDLARRSLAEQIRGTGRFAMRLGDGKALHAAAVRALQEAARRRIPRYESLSPQERVAAIAAKSGLEADALAAAINPVAVRRENELAHTIALLETARRRILE